MSETYAKLFSSILRSSIWTEPLETKIVWITMLAMSDRHGYVGASIPGIASSAGVPIDKAAEAIAKFLAPDEWSRSKDFDGRRIEEADRGWNILNYERFRDMRDEEARKEYERNRKREARQRKNVPDSLGTTRDTQGQTGTVPQCPAVSAHAEASASAEASPSEKKRTPRAAALGPVDPRFDEFWAAYDYKKDRPASLKAWEKIKPDDALAATIVAKARETRTANPAKEFYRYPATWLNARGWEDEIVPRSSGGAPRRQFQETHVELEDLTAKYTE